MRGHCVTKGRDWSDAAADQGHQRLPANHQTLRHKKGFPAGVRGRTALPGLWDNKLLLLWATHLMVLYYSSPRKQKQLPVKWREGAGRAGGEQEKTWLIQRRQKLFFEIAKEKVLYDQYKTTQQKYSIKYTNNSKLQTYKTLLSMNRTHIFLSSRNIYKMIDAPGVQEISTNFKEPQSYRQHPPIKTRHCWSLPSAPSRRKAHSTTETLRFFLPLQTRERAGARAVRAWKDSAGQGGSVNWYNLEISVQFKIHIPLAPPVHC